MSGNKCANCGKGIMYGHNVSHAKNRTRKLFKPNLHTARILIGTTRRRMKLCTKCLRMFREMEKEVLAARASKITVAAAK
ncbi:MAG: 50S ribosomal protein L28 [bacterium]|nr:50S ribosomal protein L28 [bacterium]